MLDNKKSIIPKSLNKEEKNIFKKSKEKQGIK